MRYCLAFLALMLVCFACDAQVFPKSDLGLCPGDATHVCAADLNALNAGWINVKSYGATGDGTTNDKTALQNAINACPSNGCDIVVPPGVYMVNSSTTINGLATGLSIPVGRRVRFVCPGAMSWFDSSTEHAAATFATTAALWIMNVGSTTSTGHGFSVEGCGFADLSNSGAGGLALGGIAIFRTNHGRIKNVGFDNFLNGTALQFDGSGDSNILWMVEGMNVRKTHQGIFTKCTGTCGPEITALHVIGGYFASPASGDATATAITYTGDTLRAIGVAIDDYPVGIKLQYDNSAAMDEVQSCRFENITKAIVISGAGRAIIMGNHIYSNTASAEALELNVLNAHALHLPITGNSNFAALFGVGAVTTKDNTAGNTDGSDAKF